MEAYLGVAFVLSMALASHAEMKHSRDPPRKGTGIAIKEVELPLTGLCACVLCANASASNRHFHLSV